MIIIFVESAHLMSVFLKCPSHTTGSSRQQVNMSQNAVLPMKPKYYYYNIQATEENQK